MLRSVESNARDSSWIGFIFVFNLIVGTGALTLPAVFAKCGWLLSTIIIVLLAFVSYITATFIIEAMACANAVRNWQRLQFQNDTNEEESRAEQEDDELLGSSNQYNEVDHSRMNLPPLRSIYYSLDRKFELGEMSSLFFNDCGRIIFYLCLAIYLYGDLSIYAAAVSKTIRDIACSPVNNTITKSFSPLHLHLFTFYNGYFNEDATSPCWSSQPTLTRLNVYRIFLIAFTLILGPLAAFSVQKTKHLQVLTVVCRWLAFILMISLAIKLLLTNGVKGHPPAANIYAIPTLFGACVYSFMCHHSLPNLIAPIRNKSKVHGIIFSDYILICLLYMVLALTGIFAFEHLEDLYTLNFIPDVGEHNKQQTLLMIIDYFLALFPVFTLTTSYPIVAITLRNNLQTLFLDMSRIDSYNFFVRRMLFPLITVIPPFIITYFTESLTSLVAFTGSYAGAAIQYLIPLSLVYFARRTCKDLLGNGVINQYQSFFRSVGWIIFVFIWSLGSMLLVTMNFFL